MHSRLSITTLLTCSVLLTACGGGGGSIEGIGTTSDDPDLKRISGVYNTSRADDESYLYITEQGKIIVYDYQGDDQGSGQNCYSQATHISQTNYHFNGKNVTYSGTTKYYTINTDNAVVMFKYDIKKGIENLLLNYKFNHDQDLDLKEGILNIRIGGGGSLNLPSTRIQIENITAILCK